MFFLSWQCCVQKIRHLNVFMQLRCLTVDRHLYWNTRRRFHCLPVVSPAPPSLFNLLHFHLFINSHFFPLSILPIILLSLCSHLMSLHHGTDCSFKALKQSDLWHLSIFYLSSSEQNSWLCEPVIIQRPQQFDQRLLMKKLSSIKVHPTFVWLNRRQSRKQSVMFAPSLSFFLLRRQHRHLRQLQLTRKQNEAPLF